MLIAVFGTRFGLWSAEFGLGVLTLRIGRILAFAGLAAALVAVIIALKDMRRGGFMRRCRWSWRGRPWLCFWFRSDALRFRPTTT
ncbi:hypothetical protein D3C86_1933590 [compost metagenome]